jgi:hypothetical protein
VYREASTYIDCSQIHSPLLGDKVDYDSYGCCKGPPAYVACSFFFTFFVFFTFFRLIFVSLRFFHFIFAYFTFVFASDFWCFASKWIMWNHTFFFASKRNEIFASISNFASEAKVRAHHNHDSGLHYLTFVCETKQGNQCNGASCFKKNVSE